MEKKYTTLIVDDSMAMRLVLEHCLKDTEFEIIAQANSGEDAIEKVRQFQPEIVLLDIVMF